jgi:hypothetical protein
MNTLFLKSEQLKTLYNSMYVKKTKDKIDMVLEPLQSMIQIALLSVSPIGTKLAIQENILYLQTPGFSQPISRWYHSDKKDDLYFLFQVIRRFIKWYNPEISNKSPASKNLYDLIIKMAVNGLDNLIKTYNSNDNNNIIQVIHMYKSLLESNDKIDYIKPLDDKVEIDTIFGGIVKLYDSNLISLINSFLLIIITEDNMTNIDNYIQGLNLIMTKNNNMVKNWIKVNLVF